MRCKEQLRQTFAALDPLELLNEIRQAQRQLAALEFGAPMEPAAVAAGSAELSRFVESLSKAWRDGEVRPTHRKRSAKPRTWRTRVDPFEKVWPVVEQWLIEQPHATAKELFDRLQSQGLGEFEPGQLRSLQRRVKCWRSQVAHCLIFGHSDPEIDAPVLVGAIPSTIASTMAIN
jgi:hypothetical protein